MEESITLRPIGHVVSTIEETIDEKWGDVVSRIVLLPEYRGGLDGLERFSHAVDLWLGRREHA